MAVISHVSEIVGDRQIWFVDIWGVIHNGVAPYPDAVAACEKFRDGGGSVVLVSNSPRPSAGVIQQLDDIGVTRSAYDRVVSSGDVSRKLIRTYEGWPVLHIGPMRDRGVFEGLDVNLSDDIKQVKSIVCTGLFDDETEKPEDYVEQFQAAVDRDLLMICVNPDIQVERGGRMIFCAGALAALYAELGGDVSYAGKPYQPIYCAAQTVAEDLRGGEIDKHDILAIGDGVKTDIAGALAFNIDAVYVASRVNLNDGETLEAGAERLFNGSQRRPIAIMEKLAW